VRGLHDDPEQILQSRLIPPPNTRLTVETKLEHFALISYAVPLDRLQQLIPQDRFEVVEFDIEGRAMGLVSAVPFLDADFHFCSMPRAKFKFGQTNYRAYVRYRATGEHAVWFFGTTLGSQFVRIPRALWKMPWHLAKYRFDCSYDRERSCYRRYSVACESSWSSMHVELADSGKPQVLCEGFDSLDEQILLLTHPVKGFYNCLDRGLGQYTIWHDVLSLTIGTVVKVHFGLFEELGLVTSEAMNQPHSVLMCPATTFRVYLPPTRWS
jgi:hypothetical protein